MIEQPEYSFSSTQFNIENPIKDQIQNFIKDFVDVNDLTEDGIEENSHVTVKYGIHSEHADEVRRLIQLVKPVKVILGKTSLFTTNENFDVLKIDILSKELRALNKLISKSVEVTDTHKTYSAHLTLAYLIKGTGDRYTNNKTFYGTQIIFDRLVFSPPDGKLTTTIFLNKDLE